MNFTEWLSYFGIPTLIFASMFGVSVEQVYKMTTEERAAYIGVLDDYTKVNTDWQQELADTFLSTTLTV